MGMHCMYLAGGEFPICPQVVLSLHLALSIVVIGVGLCLLPE